MKKLRVGMVGAGLQASRRIPAIINHPLTELVGISSLVDEKLSGLAKKYSLKIFATWQDLLQDGGLDVLVVTTYPNSHAQITVEALKNGLHVLCEKPLAQNVEQAMQMEKTAQKFKRILKCGFNHRFHPAIEEAKNIVDKGQIGGLLFGRGVYGYCGRPGFEKEWRSDKKYAAGGILMEQGIHLIDLFRWIFGEMEKVTGMTETSYWPIDPFEDNAMAILHTKNHQSIMLQSTNLQWRNTFCWEIYGTGGYVKVEGLGSSYGMEKLICGKKDYHGPFKETITEFRGTDLSWKKEWEEFVSAIKEHRKPSGDAKDGVKAMEIVEAIYLSSRKDKTIIL